MALPTNTTTTFDLEGLREDLTNAIYNISPMKTPLSSGVKRTKAKGTFHEWQTDALAAADTGNAHAQGDDTVAQVIAPTTRLGNHTQISKKSITTSGTAEAVDKAGRKSEHAFQMAKKGNELKRDIEAILLNPQGASAGSEGVAPTAATLLAFVKTNTSFGATGADPVYVSGAPAAARTDGTQRAFSETILQAVARSAWDEGGEPSVLMVGGFNKGVASGFVGIAQQTNEVGKTSGPRKIIGSADVYVSEWGELRVVPNRFQRDRDAWLIDYDMLAMPLLRPLFKEDLAKTGDSRKSHLVMEWTFEVKQEAGLGLVADLLTA